MTFMWRASCVVQHWYENTVTFAAQLCSCMQRRKFPLALHSQTECVHRCRYLTSEVVAEHIWQLFSAYAALQRFKPTLSDEFSGWELTLNATWDGYNWNH